MYSFKEILFALMLAMHKNAIAQAREENIDWPHIMGKINI